MEKIKTAMERAEKLRLQQAQLGNASPRAANAPAHLDETANVSSVPANRDAQGVAPDQGHLSGDIGYVQTQVVKVDQRHLERHRIRLPSSDDEVARAYDLLAARLANQVRATGWNSIAMVSAQEGEGKSTTALNLAMRLANSQQRTALVVDMDFRRPNIATYLGLAPANGVEDILDGSASVAETLVSPGVSRLTILPIRRAHTNPGGLIDSPAAANLAHELKVRYANRIVLFDLPPLLGHGDALDFMPYVDAALVVATVGRTTETALRDTIAALNGRNIIGSVMNRVDPVSSAY